MPSKGEGLSPKFLVCNVSDLIVCVLKECNNLVLETTDHEKDKRKIQRTTFFFESEKNADKEESQNHQVWVNKEIQSRTERNGQIQSVAFQ